MTKRQTRMFQYEDLPLFSGAAPRVEEQAAEPQPTDRQLSWVGCRACLDTGQIDGKRCWCPAGQQNESE